MPHNANLTDRLVDLRTAFTGEPRRAAVSAVARFASAMNHTDRTTLLELLTPTNATLPLGQAGGAVDTHLRELIPDASRCAQRELEAGVLEAACEAINQLHRRPPVSIFRPATVFLAVQPQPDWLGVRVDPIAIGPLLAELIPCPNSESATPEHDVEVTGVPGLRVRRRGHAVELRLVDAPGEALVALTGVSSRAWKAALAYLDAREELAHRCDQHYPASLSPQERWHLARYGRVHGLTTLASALLRRIGVFRRPKWIRSHVKGDAFFVMQWPPGVPMQEATSALLHPLAGLAGARIQKIVETQMTVAVSPSYRAATAYGDRFGPPDLLVWVDDPPTYEDSEMRRQWRRLPPPPEWVAWQKIYGAVAE